MHGNEGETYIIYTTGVRTRERICGRISAEYFEAADQWGIFARIAFLLIIFSLPMTQHVV